MSDQPLNSVNPVPQKRLSDLIAQAFFQARSRRDFATAGHLMAALTSLEKREAELYPNDRRFNIDAPAPGVELAINLASVEVCHDPAAPVQVVGAWTP